MNQTIQTILTRRSIRRYKPEQIEQEDLTWILRAATYAPSGSNSQSWLFTAIQDQNALQALAKLVRERIRTWDLPPDAYRGKIKTVQRAQRDDYSFFYNAPTLIIASNIKYTNAMADCALALGNICIAATSLGLGSCWINPIAWLTDDAMVRDYLATLGIPRDHVICGSAAVGFIDGDAPKAPARKPDTVHIIREGQIYKGEPYVF